MNCRSKSSNIHLERNEPSRSVSGGESNQSMNDECGSYEQRVVVYADVIGWKAACRDLSNYWKLREVTHGIAARQELLRPSEG
jgi:hypothetical protein